MKKTVRALGIMNGTSLDGIDYSLISVDQDLRAIKFLKHWQKPLPRILRKRLLQAARDESSTYEVSQLHYDLGRLYGLQVKSLMVQDKFDLIGLHGQTIHHEGRRATLQIGHPGFLSQVTGQPVYHDFRAADVMVGGEGAPFAPFFQKILIRNLNSKDAPSIT
jgi:anhydro-N-acetylmuramic acid kinase